MTKRIVTLNHTSYPLIPMNVIGISPMHGPIGWLVADYDHKGWASKQRWFAVYSNAYSYALELTRGKHD